MAYDRRCYDIAEAFLEDGLIGANHRKRIHALAQHLQTTIDDWISTNPPEMECEPRTAVGSLD